MFSFLFSFSLSLSLFSFLLPTLYQSTQFLKCGIIYLFFLFLPNEYENLTLTNQFANLCGRFCCCFISVDNRQGEITTTRMYVRKNGQGKTGNRTARTYATRTSRFLGSDAR